MDNIECLFLRLIKQVVFDEQAKFDINITEQELEKLISLSKRQICQTFIWQVLKDNTVKIPEKFNTSILHIIGTNYHKLSQQNKVLKLLYKNGIKCAVLKGSSVSINYKTPILRPLGDIDILVEEENYDKAIELLLRGEKRDALSNAHKFHYAVKLNNVTVEIHKHVTEYPENDTLIAEIMKNALDDVIVGNLDDFQFPMLNNKFQALSLLLHMKRHMLENNLTMRMLLDWLVFANGIKADEWDEYIYPILKNLNIDKFTDALFTLSDYYFGTENKEKIHSDISMSVTDALLTEFFSCGVIDTSNKLSGNISQLYSNAEKYNLKVFRWFGILNDISNRNFKIARYKIFLPLCWLYIALRYLFRVLTNKRAKISFREIKKGIYRKDNLYKDLEIK